jgi:NAD+ kinase
MYCLTFKKDRESLELAKNAVKFLKENDLKFVIDKDYSFTVSKKEILQPDFELIIAIGDDHFILKTFRTLGKLQIPVFPIASSQSFLSQANLLNFKHYLNLIKRNKYIIIQRSRLVARFANKVSEIALNDIGLFSSKSASLLKYSLVLNKEPLWTDTSDGILVSTPTGSTGYSMSAGGPIILDEPKILSLTSVSSLEKHSPVIVSDSTKIKITDVKGISPVIVVDGEVRTPINANELIIEKCPYNANFVTFSKEYSIEARLKKRTLKMSTDKLKALPASCKLIYKILLLEGSMTQKELITASMLPERTMRYALDILIANGMIAKRPHFADARQSVYLV